MRKAQYKIIGTGHFDSAGTRTKGDRTMYRALKKRCRNILKLWDRRDGEINSN